MCVNDSPERAALLQPHSETERDDNEVVRLLCQTGQAVVSVVLILQLCLVSVAKPTTKMMTWTSSAEARSVINNRETHSECNPAISLPGVLVDVLTHSRNPTVDVCCIIRLCPIHRDNKLLRTRISLLSSPTLPNRYVRPSHLKSSNATADTKEE